LNFSTVQKKILFFVTGWFLLVLTGTAAKVTIDVIHLQKEINSLQSEYDRAQLAANQLKEQFNAVAVEYLEDRKIGRIVNAVNPRLNDEHITLWIKTLKHNGGDLFAHLNNYSRQKLNISTNPYSLKTGVSLLTALAALESDFNIDTRSEKGAYGPMQLKKITARHIGIADHTDPAENINGGARYLSGLLQKYYESPDQLELALASYNAGVTRVKKEWIQVWGANWRNIRFGLIKTGRFKETRDHVSTIIALTRLFTSGRWSEMDQYFWSNYRWFIFQSKYVFLHTYQQSETTGSIPEDS